MHIISNLCAADGAVLLIGAKYGMIKRSLKRWLIHLFPRQHSSRHVTQIKH
jgi:hypothetical protein